MLAQPLNFSSSCTKVAPIVKNPLLLIPARMGSKEIPNKNLVLLGGKPLITWTIEQALLARVGSVVVSTDSPEIAKVAMSAGASVPFLRPQKLAGDNVKTIDVVQHALEWLSQNLSFMPRTVVLLQPTSPFRSADDILTGLRLLETSEAPAVVSVCEANTHPWTTRKLDSYGCLSLFCQISSSPRRRQEMPPAYQLNGALYIIHSHVLLETRSFEPPGTRAILMPAERSLDIDSPADLEWAQWQLSRR
jgi:CMP-N-acetylneuraminic acid synthetase